MYHWYVLQPSVLFIIRRRCLILLVRHNEYLIGFEVEEQTHIVYTIHCKIVVVFFVCVVDDASAFMVLHYTDTFSVLWLTLWYK